MLTAVGLLLLAGGGINIDELMDGAVLFMKSTTIPI